MQPQQLKTAALSPEPLVQMHWGFMTSRTLSSAVQLQVFSHIAAGKTTAAEIARAAHTNERATRMLLDALVGFELLKKADGRYQLAPLTAEYLVRESPNYMGYLMETTAEQDPWQHLTESIVTGKPQHKVEDQKVAEAFFPRLVRTLHVWNREPARRAAELLCGSDAPADMRVLDLGSGSGVWGIAVAEAHPRARVTAQDYPGMLDVTQEFVKRHGVEACYDYLPGALRDVDFDRNKYDLAILGNIVHSEGERASRTLFRRLARALRPRGRVAIIDMIPNAERTGPPFPLLFALNMLVHTEAGDVYTFGEYRGWLNEAGFPRVEAADIGSHSPMIIGHKD